MSASQTILELTEDECIRLVDTLLPLDAQLDKRLTFMLQQNPSMKTQEALEYIVTDNPILWAKVYLNWTTRDYQMPIIREGKNSRNLVLRLGRRLGKSESLCVLILWFAYTQYNKGPNNQYDILILTPYENQIDLIFRRIKQFVDASPLLSSIVSRDISHHVAFDVRGITSNILGFTAGANNSSSGANSVRGQRADGKF